MDDTTLQDLKQFIAATVSQQLAGLRSDVRRYIKELDSKLSAKIDGLSQSIADALENSHEATDGQLEDHEQRITKLEQGAT
jgi:hypothetical protein